MRTERVMKQVKAFRIKKLKMPSFCVNQRIPEAVTLYTVHEKCSSSMNHFCLSGETVLSWWLLLGASLSALRFVCCRCLLGERSVKEEIIHADAVYSSFGTEMFLQKIF